MMRPNRSPRRRIAGLVVVACVWSAADLLTVDAARAPGPPQSSDLVLWNGLAPYLSVIADYRAGRSRQALWEIAFWSGDALKKDHERLERLRHRIRVCRETTPDIDGRAFAGEIEVADLDAAVLLHTDALLAALETPSATAGAWQLVAARWLLEWTREQTDGLSRVPSDLPPGCDPPPALERRDWYLAVTWTLLAYWEANLADLAARNGLDAAPDDPELLLAAGTVKEALALDATQFPGQRPRLPRALRDEFGDLPRPDAGRSLREALALYQRALAVRPVYLQTHLRLGRVLSLLGRLDEARAELELAAAHADEARERYLAELFLARVAEQANDRQTAIGHYGRALDAWPDSQAARIGLVDAIGHTDGEAGVPRQLGELLAQPWPRPIVFDPWWTYPFGEAERGVRLLDELRGRFVETP